MKYNRLLQISFLVALGVSVGCVKKESGFCPAPQEDLQWVYIVESNGLMTASKCIVCDTSVDPANYHEWAQQNSVYESGGPSAESATPCLYVYNRQGENWTSKNHCSEMACEDEPNVGDGVGKGGGAWRVIEEILGNPSAALNDPEQNHMMIGSLETPHSGFQAQTTENTDLASISENN